MSEETNNTEQDAEDDWGEALAEQAATEKSEAAVIETDNLEQAKLENLTGESLDHNEAVNLESILDIPISLSVEIGQTRISIRNLLQLNQGSVVELDRLAGEPLDVMVNNTLVAHGEVVVVNEKYGIRLTDVISAHDRVKQLH